jgi:hypothetical protein
MPMVYGVPQIAAEGDMPMGYCSLKWSIYLQNSDGRWQMAKIRDLNKGKLALMAVAGSW